MVQDLTDVLCTAGKQSAVLPLVPFQFSSAISLSNLPPPHFPLSLFSSHCLSLILSLTLFPFHLHLYPLPYFNTPSISLSQFGLLPLPIYSPATVPFPFSFYPLPHSSSIFPFSLFPSHCFFLHPPPTIPFPPSSLFYLPFFSLLFFPVSLFPATALYPLQKFPFHFFLPPSLYSVPFFICPFFPFSLFPSHCLSPFTALSVILLPRPLPLFSPRSLILIFPKKTGPNHDSILKAVTF